MRREAWRANSLPNKKPAAPPTNPSAAPSARNSRIRVWLLAPSAFITAMSFLRSSAMAVIVAATASAMMTRISALR